MLSYMPEALGAYIEAHSTPQSELHSRLAAETRAKTSSPNMMVGNVEGLLLRTLVRACGARRVLELGTFTGYSALAMAEGLPEDGSIVTCDVDPDATAIARRYWDQSPHGYKIRLELGPALDTVAAVEGGFDMAFIDADKENYIRYWEAVVPKVRRGGLIVVDNVLWSGRILDPRSDEDRAIAAFNDHAAGDGRVELVVLPIRDGLTVATRL